MPQPSSTTARTRRLLAMTCCAVALLGAAACGSEAERSSSSSADASARSALPATGLVGPGCADYAKLVPSGAGSFAGMAKDPTATAVSNSPLLTSFVKAVSGKLNAGVDLVEDLNSGELTVFAPVDDAFAKLPATRVAALSQQSGTDTLRAILDTHVVRGRLSPEDIDGTFNTLAHNTITVRGSGDDLTVNGAKVICGGAHTANATVYLIDSVLKPAGGHF